MLIRRKGYYTDIETWDNDSKCCTKCSHLHVDTEKFRIFNAWCGLIHKNLVLSAIDDNLNYAILRDEECLNARIVYNEPDITNDKHEARKSLSEAIKQFQNGE
jgi:hypothetical protein